MDGKGEHIKDDESEDKKRRKKKYLSNLAKQGLINISFLTLAFSNCIRGPALMDLQEIYEVSLETISFSLTAAGLGGLFGSFCTGYVLMKYRPNKYYVIFAILSITSVCSAILPHAGNIWVYFMIVVCIGFVLSGMHTVVNVLCMEIWHGFNGAPYMHSMHFSFSVGALLAPVITKHFLSSNIYLDQHANNNSSIIDIDNDDPNHNNSSLFNNSTAAVSTSITLLYPLTGALLLFFSLGFAFLGFKEQKRRKKSKTNTINNDDNVVKPPPPSVNFTPNKRILLATVVVFIVIYLALEFSLLMYIPTFAVRAFGRTKSDGANLLTVALAPYALARGLSIFLAVFMTPMQILILNLTFMTTGTGVLLLAGDKYWILVQVGLGIAGFGMGSIIANTFVWMRQYMPMTGTVAAWMNVGVGLGQNVAVVVGLVIDTEPLFLIYFQAGTIAVSVALFVFGSWVGRKVLRENELEKEKAKEDEMEEKEKLNTVL